MLAKKTPITDIAPDIMADMVIISGPCNSFYCLGHFKNVYDDDDDDNGERWMCAYQSALCWSCLVHAVDRFMKKG